MSNLEIVGLGALNIDHIYKVERILGDGETVERRPRYEDSELELLDTCPGGSAANTIYGLAKLGINTGFIGAVGDDAEGKLLLRDFEKVGVDISQIKVKPKAKTGLARCVSDKLNFRKISVSPATANSLLAMEDIDLDYLNRVEVLHISSFVDDAQLKVLLELMDGLDLSIEVSFSPGALYAAKGLKVLAPILARTYVLFINQDEIQQLTVRNFETGAEECLAQGCQVIVVTLGRGLEIQRGTSTPPRVIGVSYVRDAKSKYIIETPSQSELASIDTTGAGDAFATGFLYGLLKGKNLEECGRLGDIVARFSITQIGARQGLPTINELSQRYRELYNKEL